MRRSAAKPRSYGVPAVPEMAAPGAKGSHCSHRVHVVTVAGRGRRGHEAPHTRVRPCVHCPFQHVCSPAPDTAEVEPTHTCSVV
jgi:hypothetical protein